MRLGVALLASLGMVVGACAAPPAPVRDDISSSVERLSFIPAPKGGTFGVITWIPGQDRLALSYDPPAGVIGDTHIYTTGLGDTALRLLALPADPPCSATFHVVPQALPDGRLAYMQGCVGPIPRVPEEANALMAYDFVTGQSSRVFPYYLHANEVQFALAPDLHAAVISNGNGLHEQLLWLRPSGASRVEGLSFERVWGPTWSPDGRSIALAAVAIRSSTAGLARLDLPWGVYTLDAQGTNPRLLLQAGSGGVGALAWSPDSRWLLGSMAFGDEDPPGLWLIEVATGRASLVVAGREQPGGAAWLPDGRTILVSVGTRSHEPIVVPARTPAERVGIAVLRLPPLTR